VWFYYIITIDLLINKKEMKSKPLNILLANKDRDDCLFFQLALKELPISSNLSIVYNGEELIEFFLKNNQPHPDVLFIDLNLPQKKGFECLAKINGNEILKHLIIVMYSTSSPKCADYERKLIAMLHHIEALPYNSKPDKFTKLKIDIYQVLKMVAEKKLKKVKERDLYCTTAQ
jgi:CheY-like chemotaxis protein